MRIRFLEDYSSSTARPSLPFLSMTGVSSTKSLTAFIIFLLGAVVSPLLQLALGFTSVAYTNALDEASYLQYGYSKLTSEQMLRPAQRLVTALHEIGFSGGGINLLFDLLLPGAIVLIVAHAMAPLVGGFRFSLYAVTLGCFAVHLVNTANPILSFAYDFVLSSNLLQWVTLPASSFSPLYRSPEPQVSFLLLGIAGWWAAKLKSPLPFVVVTPFLYSFLALPTLFCSFGYMLLGKVGERPMVRLMTLGILILSLYVLLALYYRYIAGDLALHLSIRSHLPIFSVTGCIAVLLYFAERKHLSGDGRRIGLLLAATPWVCANHQLVSGYLSQPSNFETYSGTLCAVYFIVCRLIRSSSYQRWIIPLCVIFWGSSIVEYGLRGSGGVAPARLVRELEPQLRSVAGSVLINDPLLATAVDLGFPKQSPSGFSITRVYLGITDTVLHEYLCARKFIAESPHQAAFSNALQFLDACYRNEVGDAPLNTLRRKEFPVDRHSLELERGCPAVSYILSVKPELP